MKAKVPPKFTGESVADGKLFLREHFNEGARCPCCNQLVKLYKRKLNAGMAYGLIKAYQLGGKDDFIHVPTVFTEHGINTSNSEFSKLRYWGLVEEKINEDTSKRNSGYWKVTEKGADFIHRRIMVDKYIHLFDGKLINGGEQVQVMIGQCLGDSFDYEELMDNRRVAPVKDRNGGKIREGDKVFAELGDYNSHFLCVVSVNDQGKFVLVTDGETHPIEHAKDIILDNKD